MAVDIGALQWTVISDFAFHFTQQALVELRYTHLCIITGHRVVLSVKCRLWQQKNSKKNHSKFALY